MPKLEHLERRRSAFTLVELVVVVLILGIFVAVAAPRVFDSAGDAREAGTRRSLAVVRDAIELHRAKTGSYPPAASLAEALRDYLKGPFPAPQAGVNQNPAVAASTQSPITSPVSGGAGWVYNEATGQLVVNDAAYIAW
ncbi:MAG TPA: prepilin-type N-terminal cleavage/methylation domain-containing protein [Planctomycetaceae bacterium]|nr:prepilin-type N-terminal cleavage/methylation domain-containing protein [Planctomycetaceae bacterium]